MAEWDHTFAVNVRAAAYLCEAVLPEMQARKFGQVISVGSEAGVAIVPGLAAYCVSKHALRALTEVIQDGNHDNGIKAWVICPGFVDTDTGYVVPGANPSSYLRVDEVVDVVRFLLRLGETSSSARRSSSVPCVTRWQADQRTARPVAQRDL
jgi:short-subunit dehydrogenase